MTKKNSNKKKRSTPKNWSFDLVAVMICTVLMLVVGVWIGWQLWEQARPG